MSDPSERDLTDETAQADQADAHHEVVAGRDLAQGLAGDILFGARALMAVEGRFSAMVLSAWERGRHSLRPDHSTAGALAS